MSLLRIKAILLSIALASITLVVFIAAASNLSIQEAQLSPGSSVWEINKSKDDRLIISHPGAEEIWQEFKANTYTVYQNITDVQDAKTDSLGNIWWSDRASLFGRISTPTLVVTTWQVPNGQNIWGLALDNQDKLWMTGWSDSDSNLFNYDLISSQLCTYTLPTSANSHYVVNDDGNIWLGSREADRIYRVTESITDALVSWWDMPESLDIGPNGLVPDDNGNLWWADQQLGGLGFLDSSIDQLLFYALPLGAEPQMALLESGWVWYTEISSDTDGTIGVLDPGVAKYITSTLTADSTMIAPTCGSLIPLRSEKAISRTETLTWTIPVTLTPEYAQDGWWIYGIPAEPYGLVEKGSKLFVTEQSSQKLLRMPLPRLGQLNLTVTPIISKVVHGDTLEYIYGITYTNRDGSSAKDIQLMDDGCQPITGPSGDLNMDGLLDVKEIWKYSCTALIPDHDDEESLVPGTVSTATVSGKDADNYEMESDREITVVPIVHDKGLLNVEKDGPDAAAHGESITFDYAVTYGSLDDASAINVEIDDDKCSSISPPDGDTDEDGRLDVSETWTYTCQTTVPNHVEGEENPWTSTATAGANNFDGQKVEPAIDQHDIYFAHTRGRLILTKLGPKYGEHGEQVTFDFILAFENPDRSAANSVTVNDDKCGLAYLVTGDTNGDKKLNVGEFWHFQCKYLIPPHRTGETKPIVNRAVSRGMNEDDKSVLSGADQHRMGIIEGHVYLPILGG